MGGSRGGAVGETDGEDGEREGAKRSVSQRTRERLASLFWDPQWSLILRKQSGCGGPTPGRVVLIGAGDVREGWYSLVPRSRRGLV
jgi:hypothetical protein